MGVIPTQIMARFIKDVNVLSVVSMQDSVLPSATTANDLTLYVVSAGIASSFTVHYIREGRRIQERWMSTDDLKQSLLSDNEWFQWAIQGNVLLDRDSFLKRMQKLLLQSPRRAIERRILSEFSLYLEVYRRCKQFLNKGELLDAYTCILETIEHWARIIVLEDGQHPELLVWRQVHDINPGIFKLYEELTLSEETLEQRIRLVLLACDFSVMSKVSNCCGLLVRVIGSEPKLWSIHELSEHQDLKGIKLNMPLIMKKLVAHALIVEEVVYNERMDIDELCYRLR